MIARVDCPTSMALQSVRLVFLCFLWLKISLAGAVDWRETGTDMQLLFVEDLTIQTPISQVV